MDAEVTCPHQRPESKAGHITAGSSSKAQGQIPKGPPGFQLKANGQKRELSGRLPNAGELKVFDWKIRKRETMQEAK